MTDAECAETLAEFRLLTLGPRLSEALDHAIGRLRPSDPLDQLFSALAAPPHRSSFRETAVKVSLA